MTLFEKLTKMCSYHDVLIVTDNLQILDTILISSPGTSFDEWFDMPDAAAFNVEILKILWASST